MTFNFTIRFTREDEQHAIVHEIGYNAYGTGVTDAASAEAQVRRHCDHLTLLSVVLTAVMDEDGTVLNRRKLIEMGVEVEER